MKRRLRPFPSGRPLAGGSRHVGRPRPSAVLNRSRRQPACGPLRTVDCCINARQDWRGIRPPGCPAPLMSPGLGLRPKPPPLLRCAGHPRGPIRQQWLFAIVERHPCGLPRAWGGRWSEVKEETAAARPSSGDMSVSGRPTNAARATVRTRAQQQITANGRNGPGADDRQTSSVCWDSFILDDGAVQPTSIWPPSWVFLPYCNAPSGGTIETTDVHLLRCTKCGLDLNGDDPCFTNSTRPSAR